MGQKAEEVLYYYLMSEGTMDRQMWQSMDKKMTMVRNTTGAGESKMGQWTQLAAKPHIGDLAPSPAKREAGERGGGGLTSPPKPEKVQQKLNFSSVGTPGGSSAMGARAATPPPPPPLVVPPSSTAPIQQPMLASDGKTILDPEVKKRIEMNRLAALAKRQQRMLEQQQRQQGGSISTPSSSCSSKP